MKRHRWDPFADTARDPLSSKLPRSTGGGGAAAARWGRGKDLSQELKALADYVAPSPEEDRARHDLIERLRDLLASMAPGSQCELFGSWPAGLSTWNGDIDVAVSGGGVSLDALAARLRVEGWAERVEHISSARVPIVTFQDRRSELWCDCSLATGAGHATRSFLQRYASRHAAFRPVCVLLKLLLDQQQLHKAYRGGVSSYRVYVLVAHLLDAQPTAAALPAGPLLLLALEHYGRRVDWQVTSSLSADGGSEMARFDAATFQIWEVVDLLRASLHALKGEGGGEGGGGGGDGGGEGGSLARVLDAAVLCTERDASRAAFKRRAAFFQHAPSSENAPLLGRRVSTSTPNPTPAPTSNPYPNPYSNPYPYPTPEPNPSTTGACACTGWRHGRSSTARAAWRPGMTPPRGGTRWSSRARRSQCCCVPPASNRRRRRRRRRNHRRRSRRLHLRRRQRLQRRLAAAVVVEAAAAAAAVPVRLPPRARRQRSGRRRAMPAFVRAKLPKRGGLTQRPLARRAPRARAAWVARRTGWRLFTATVPQRVSP